VDSSVKKSMRPVYLVRRKKNLENYLRDCRQRNREPGLHVGCAGSPLQDWFNCDFDTLSREVNYVDATKRLSFDDNVFSFVFSEHFIEHLGFSLFIRTICKIRIS
jgi:hypothetical protein